MARSIGDWFKDHANSSLGDGSDDEVVETQAPWDVRAANTATTRTERRNAGFGGPRGGRVRGAGRSAASPGKATAKAGARASARRHTPDVPGLTADLESRIRQAAEAFPGIGPKRLARHLREKGFLVTKAQVAAVLARPRVAPKRTASRAAPKRKPAMVIRASGAQRSRVEHATELCPSCGVRPTIEGNCRCS